jgi:uncharacterized protein
MPMLARWLAALCVAFVCAVAPVRAAPDYPAFTGLVVDDAHVLSSDDRAALTRKLEDLQQKTGVQFAVATVPSLGGLEIEPYANALFRKWGAGQKGANNGLLLILAPNERKLRFEVGYGLEGAMTDAQSKLILRNSMVPKLKAKDPAGALKAGVDDAIAVLTNKDAALPQAAGSDDSLFATTFFVIFLVGVLILVVLILLARAVRRSGGTSTSSSSGTGWQWGSAAGGVSSGSDTSSGSSSGGDSFSGGGGGDSGGGGASDSY